MRSSRLFPLALVLFGFVACSSPSDDSAPAPKPIPPTENIAERPQALIISPDTFTQAYTPLAQWRTSTGLPTKVVALSDALSGGSGSDDAARLRDFLHSEYVKGDLRFVTLGGDSDVMPVRVVRAHVSIPVENVDETEDVAADMYFADLDSDWDSDHDGNYGELEDHAELLPDIAVGRIPASTPEEAEQYVAKLLKYERSPAGDYEGKTLLVGSYAGMGMNASSGLELYIAKWLPEDMPVTRLYSDIEHRPKAKLLSKESLLDAWHTGHNMTFIMGHGYEQSIGPLENLDDVGEIDNPDRPAVLYTCECLGGRFDYDKSDSSGEVFVNGRSGGVVYIGSTNLGVGFPSIALLMRYFTRGAYDGTQGPKRVGALLQHGLRSYSEPKYLYQDGTEDRWTQFVTVLLGDAATALWTGPLRTARVSLEREDCKTARLRVTNDANEPLEGVRVAGYDPAGPWLGVVETDEDGLAGLASERCWSDQVGFTITGATVRPVTVH